MAAYDPLSLANSNKLGTRTFLSESKQPRVEYEAVATAMTMVQTVEYEKRRAMEINNSKRWKDIPKSEKTKEEKRRASSDEFVYRNYIKSKEVGNFLYPPAIQAELNKPSINTLKNATRFDTGYKDGRSSDVATDFDKSTKSPGGQHSNGWMSPDILTTLDKHGPKLTNMLNMILTSIDNGQKSVVFTKYRNHYGLNLISTLLRYLNVPHIVLSGEVTQANRITMITTFNGSNGIVLLSNVDLPGDLINVSNIHFFEGTDTTNVVKYVNHVSKFLSTVPLVTVTFHIAQKADGTDAADMISYKRIVDTFKVVT